MGGVLLLAIGEEPGEEGWGNEFSSSILGPDWD